jgi:hypothetical protein
MTPTANGEVTIICLTDTVHLHDIGVHLTRGHRANIPMSQAMKSRDLSAAKLDGTVTVQTLRSAATVRAQEFTSSDTTHSQAPRHNPVPPAPPVVPLESNSIVAAIERLTVEVQGMRADITRLQQQPPATVAPVMDFTELREYVRSLPRGVPHAPMPASVWPTQEAEAPEERFIPSNLTGGVTAPDLKVASETSTSPQLTGTAEALKAARKKR